MKNRNRILYFDTLKLLAVVWIFFCHFAHKFNDDFLQSLYQGASGVFFYGFTGTWATTLLAVISGFFSYQSGKKSNLAYFIIKRYVMFFLIFLITQIVVSVFMLFPDGSTHGLLEILKSSLLLDSSIYPHFWWIRSFLIGDIVSFTNSNFKPKKYVFAYILTEIIVFYFVDVWVSICVLGNIIHLVNNQKNCILTNISKNAFLKVTILILFVFLIKHDGEHRIIHFVWGLSSFVLIILIECSYRIKKILGNEFISRFGKYTISIFSLHRTIYLLFGFLLFRLTFIPYKILFFLVFVILLMITVAFAIPLESFIRKTTILISNYLYRIFKTE